MMKPTMPRKMTPMPTRITVTGFDFGFRASAWTFCFSEAVLMARDVPPGRCVVFFITPVADLAIAWVPGFFTLWVAGLTASMRAVIFRVWATGSWAVATLDCDVRAAGTAATAAVAVFT